jgi:hypothetical protein
MITNVAFLQEKLDAASEKVRILNAQIATQQTENVDPDTRSANLRTTRRQLRKAKEAVEIFQAKLAAAKTDAEARLDRATVRAQILAEGHVAEDLQWRRQSAEMGIRSSVNDAIYRLRNLASILERQVEAGSLEDAAQNLLNDLPSIIGNTNFFSLARELADLKTTLALQATVDRAARLQETV